MKLLWMELMKLAVFHFWTHALFKALLFVYVGANIHNINNCQDIRLMGSLRSVDTTIKHGLKFVRKHPQDFHWKMTASTAFRHTCLNND